MTRAFYTDDTLLSVARATFGNDWFTADDLARTLGQLTYTFPSNARSLTVRLNALADDYGPLASFLFGYTTKQYMVKS